MFQIKKLKLRFLTQINMNYLQNKISGFNRRIKCIKYGMFYFRNTDFKIPRTLLINGIKKELRYKNLSIHEFTEICINDCYYLNYLKRKLRKVSTIVDIGANQGMFLIAARQYFPSAHISGYEPNIQLKNFLSYNANQLNVKVYYEAVMKNDCTVALNYTESDLATTVRQSENGTVSGTSFRKVVDRAGLIDILKMDCEGAEWELMENIHSWKKVKSLALEYHLWSKPGINHTDVINMVLNLGFKIYRHSILSSDQGLIIAINKQFHTNG